MSSSPKSIAAIVQSEWNNFRISSSVRGLRRTKASPTLSLRIFWTIFLLVSLGITIAQINNVLSVFLQQRDATIMQVRKQENSPQKFPAMSFCRQQPFAKGSVVTQRLREHNATFLSHEEYSLFLNQQTESLSHNLTAGKLSEESLNILVLHDTLPEFIAQIPTAAIPEVAMSLDHLILFLIITNQDFSTDVYHVSFDTLREFTNRTIMPGFTSRFIKHSTFYHSRYLLCHTVEFALPEEALKRITAVEMLLWNPEAKFSTDSQNSASRAAALQGFLTGDSILMALHPPEVHGTSVIHSSAIHLQHGRMNELYFDVIMTGFVNCVGHKLQHGSSGEFNFTSSHCRLLELDAQFREKCNCTYDPMAFPMPRCGHLLKGQSVMSELSKRNNCFSAVSGENAACKLPPCALTEYVVSPLFYDWGINDFQWKWFWEFVADWNGSLPQYWHYRGLDASRRSQTIQQPLFNFTEVRRHLSTLRIARRSLQTTFETEVALTSTANMLSSLGGALSMYMGVTVTLVAEIVEFFVLVVRTVSSRNRAVIEVQEASNKQ